MKKWISRIKDWFNKRIIRAQWIHKDRKSRMKFRMIYLGVLLGIFCIFLIAVVLFYLFGVKFNENDPEQYPYVWPASANYIYLGFGLLVFLIALILSMLAGIYFPIVYKESRTLWFQTKEYKDNVLKYGSEDLSKYNKIELKWLFKLGYISRVERDTAGHKVTPKNEV